jgi:RNA polymerase sigma-70 factor, ECF subfamily
VGSMERQPDVRAASKMTEPRLVFERLAAGLQKPIFNAAVRLSGNVEDGLDLARLTFIRAYALYAAGLRPGPFRAWLYQVMFEVHREKGPSSPPEWLDITGSVDDSVLLATSSRSSLEFVRRPDLEPLDRALLALPEELRAVFLLCDIEGFSYTQIARIVRCPRPLVSGRVCQARRMVHCVLREHPNRRPPIER